MPSFEVVALGVLALCWACALSASTMLVAVAPLAARDLGVSEKIAPFTCGTFLLGAALCSAPSAPIFNALGRRGGFLCGALAGILGGTLGALSTTCWRSEALLFAACALVGLAQGMAYFYRFAALEVCHPSRKPLAVTLVLSGGVIAAFAGPQLSLLVRSGGVGVGSPPAAGLYGEDDVGGGGEFGSGPDEGGASAFARCFIAIGALHLLNALLALAVSSPPAAAASSSEVGDTRAPLCGCEHASACSQSLAHAAVSVEPGHGSDGKAASAFPGASPTATQPSALPPCHASVNGQTGANVCEQVDAVYVELQPRTPLCELLKQRACWSAVVIGALGQTAMVCTHVPGLRGHAHIQPACPYLARPCMRPPKRRATRGVSEIVSALAHPHRSGR